MKVLWGMDQDEIDKIVEDQNKLRKEIEDRELLFNTPETPVEEKPATPVKTEEKVTQEVVMTPVKAEPVQVQEKEKSP